MAEEIEKIQQRHPEDVTSIIHCTTGNRSAILTEKLGIPMLQLPFHADAETA